MKSSDKLQTTNYQQVRDAPDFLERQSSTSLPCQKAFDLVNDIFRLDAEYKGGRRPHCRDRNDLIKDLAWLVQSHFDAASGE